MLELKHIYKSFKAKKVLIDINLSFEDSGFVAIIGESGSGKSTLINIMSGIEAADCGELIFNGENISFENESDRIKYILKNVAYMPQKQVLLNDKTVYENLKEILTIYHIEDETQIHTVLKQVHLNETYKNRIVSTLSTGEAQRVCIAASLLKQTNILVLDEATENLDPANREFIMGILKELSKDKLVVLVTHDTFLAKKYVDRMITISNREIYSDELLYNEVAQVVEESIEETITGKKRKRIALSFTNCLIYVLVPLIMVFLIAILSIWITPEIETAWNYPVGYYHINKNEKNEFTENEFRIIYEEENTYFIFNHYFLFDMMRGFIDYEFNYNLSKKIMKYNEVIVSDSFLENNPDFNKGYEIIEIIKNEKPVIIFNYNLLLEHHLGDEAQNVEALYKFYQEGGFESKRILSTNPKKTLALNLPIENSYEQVKNFEHNNYAMQSIFGITICTIMLGLCISLYIVFVNKQSSDYYNMIAFYRVCGQTNLEIRKRLKTKLYLGPIGFVAVMSGIVHMLVFFVFKTIEYDKCAFRFDIATYLISLGVTLFLLISLNEIKNFIVLKTKLKKLIKSR